MAPLTDLWGDLSALGFPTPGTKPSLTDFTCSVWIAMVLLGMRWTYDKIVPPMLARALERAKGKGGGKPAFAIADNAWIAFFAGALTVFAWYVTLNENGGCTPWHAWPCLGGWPEHVVAFNQRTFMVAGFSYYLYECLGTIVKIGTNLKRDMVAHHLVTMALALIAYNINLKRMCVMWQALFDVSNPLLHIAKGLHSANVPALEPLKHAMFKLFALSFLVCRVIMGPYSILWPSFTVGLEVLPPTYSYPCLGLMVFVYGLQLVWFYKIVEIAVKGDKAADKRD